MKKIRIWLLIFTALFCVSCSQIEPAIVDQPQTSTGTTVMPTESTDELPTEWVDERERVYKTYFKGYSTLVISDEKHLHYADKTVEFLVALTEDFEAAIKSTQVSNEQREYMKPRLKNRKIFGISQIQVADDSYLIYGWNCDVIAYVFFADDDEHKVEFYIDFEETKNGELIVCFLYPDGLSYPEG